MSVEQLSQLFLPCASSASTQFNFGVVERTRADKWRENEGELI